MNVKYINTRHRMPSAHSQAATEHTDSYSHMLRCRLSGCFAQWIVPITSNTQSTIRHNVPAASLAPDACTHTQCNIATSIIFTYLFIKCYSIFNVRNCFDLYYLNGQIKWEISQPKWMEWRSVLTVQQLKGFNVEAKYRFHYGNGNQFTMKNRLLNVDCCKMCIKFYNYFSRPHSISCISVCSCHFIRIKYCEHDYCKASLEKKNFNSLDPFRSNQQFRQTSLDLWCEIFPRLISSKQPNGNI